MGKYKRASLILIIFFIVLFNFNIEPGLKLDNSLNFNINTNINRWALIIGISDYPGFQNDLFYSDNDAMAIKSWLINQNFPKENVKILINSQATKNNIEAQINWISNRCNNNDYFFFFFSGHGDKNGSDTSIVPYDWSINGDIDEYELKSFFDQINCSKLIALFDSCYSGGLIDSLEEPNRIIISACGRSESSIEDQFFLKHGIFTAFFLDAYYNLNGDVNGDEKVTLEEAFNYTYNKSASYSHDFFGYTQHAQLYDGIPGEFFLGPYIEVYYVPIHFGTQFAVINFRPLGFNETLTVHFTIYLNNIPFQSIILQNVSSIENIKLNLPQGTYEFQFSTTYKDGKYYGNLYKLEVLGIFQSIPGIIIILVSIVGTTFISIFLLIVYKRQSLIKLVFKHNSGGN